MTGGAEPWLAHTTRPWLTDAECRRTPHSNAAYPRSLPALWRPAPPRTNESFRLRPIQLERNGINLLLELMQKQQG